MLTRSPAAGVTPLLKTLDGLRPIALRDLEERAALQRRVDRKYLVPLAVLERLVAALAGDHDALEIQGRRVFGYESVYFDTPDLRCFRDHVEGREPRFKVRSRLYTDSGASAFELKVKLGDGETAKESLDEDRADHGRLTEAAEGFLQHHLGRLLELDELPPLEHSLATTFRRATLGARSGAERVTCDVALELRRPDGTAVRLIDDHAIVETKSEGGDGRADHALRELGAEPVSLSKYRVGIGLLAARDPEPQLGGAPQRWFAPLGDQTAAS